MVTFEFYRTYFFVIIKLRFYQSYTTKIKNYHSVHDSVTYFSIPSFPFLILAWHLLVIRFAYRHGRDIMYLMSGNI